MNHHHHISYSFLPATEPATTESEIRLTIKINRKTTNQTEIKFSIAISTTANGHLSDETIDLMEHMLAYHDIFYPTSSEIIGYASDQFAQMALPIPNYAGTLRWPVLSINDYDHRSIYRIDVDEATIELRDTRRVVPNPEEAYKACTICQDQFIPTTELNSLKCNHIFHHICIVEWIIHNLSCPICRETNI